MKTFRYSLVFIVSIMIMMGCSGKKFKKNPVDDIVRSMPTDRIFSVILYDMDVSGSIFQEYHHQYRIIEEKEPGKPEERITDWYDVDKKLFERHANDMGMELAARDSTGKLNKAVAPPGYNNYVGNPQYGYWNNSGGSSFWAFYGQYAFMSSMFNMMSYPVRRSYYNDYRGNYYGRGRSYYGPTSGGRSYYGTNSNYTRSTRPNSVWSNNRSSFKQRVTNRTSRSSSRYGSSRSRSRGGGFGK